MHLLSMCFFSKKVNGTRPWGISGASLSLVIDLDIKDVDPCDHWRCDALCFLQLMLFVSGWWGWKRWGCWFFCWCCLHFYKKFDVCCLLVLCRFHCGDESHQYQSWAGTEKGRIHPTFCVLFFFRRVEKGRGFCSGSDEKPPHKWRDQRFLLEWFQWWYINGVIFWEETLDHLKLGWDPEEGF